MTLYDWLKALHVISVIAWMAGMLYLPRLFVYHADAKPGSELSETFKVMERRLLRAIIDPAMSAAWIFGLWMAWLGDLWGEPWFQAKLALVIAMSTMHGFLSRWRRHFAADANRRSARFYRPQNEVPTLLMIGIVILVIVRPF
jgi:putative membrane protein